MNYKRHIARNDQYFMKGIFATSVCLLAMINAFGQANILPAKLQSKPIAIIGATVHIGNGKVIENGYVAFSEGKITGVGDASVVRFNTDVTDVINAQGKHVYPGFIAANTSLGLVEIASGARGTDDQADIGVMNPHIRSLIAYNADSKVIPTVRSNGILLAQPTPSGGTITGQSSIVKLDGWNWEDAVYKADIGVHLNWPAIRSGRGFGTSPTTPTNDPKEIQQKAIADLETYFSEARAYSGLARPTNSNSRFESLKGLFNGSKRLFVHVNRSKDIISAVNFAKKMNVNMVIVGGSESYLVTDILRENKVPVILIETQTLPERTDDDVYLSYKLPKLLQDGGVLFGLTGIEYWRQRNLPFEAGNSVAYGLTKEEALSMITLNIAKILGIDSTTGSLEPGKDATLFISDGDALDMLGNKVRSAYIEGRHINLDNLHKQLYKRYSEKYQLKDQE